jgi:hypothetical protein
LVRNIGERAVPIVVVEPVASVGGHVEIFVTVVVVVADGYSHPVALALQARFRGYFFERSVGLLVEQPDSSIVTQSCSELSL